MAKNKKLSVKREEENKRKQEKLRLMQEVIIRSEILKEALFCIVRPGVPFITTPACSLVLEYLFDNTGMLSSFEPFVRRLLQHRAATEEHRLITTETVKYMARRIARMYANTLGVPVMNLPSIILNTRLLQDVIASQSKSLLRILTPKSVRDKPLHHLDTQALTTLSNRLNGLMKAGVIGHKVFNTGIKISYVLFAFIFMGMNVTASKNVSSDATHNWVKDLYRGSFGQVDAIMGEYFSLDLILSICLFGLIYKLFHNTFSIDYIDKPSIHVKDLESLMTCHQHSLGKIETSFLDQAKYKVFHLMFTPNPRDNKMSMISNIKLKDLANLFATIFNESGWLILANDSKTVSMYYPGKFTKEIKRRLIDSIRTAIVKNEAFYPMKSRLIELNQRLITALGPDPNQYQWQYFVTNTKDPQLTFYLICAELATVTIEKLTAICSTLYQEANVNFQQDTCSISIDVRDEPSTTIQNKALAEARKFRVDQSLLPEAKVTPGSDSTTNVLSQLAIAPTHQLSAGVTGTPAPRNRKKATEISTTTSSPPTQTVASATTITLKDEKLADNEVWLHPPFRSPIRAKFNLTEADFDSKDTFQAYKKTFKQGKYASNKRNGFIRRKNGTVENGHLPGKHIVHAEWKLKRTREDERPLGFVDTDKKGEFINFCIVRKH